jgi:hypothetical protein
MLREDGPTHLQSSLQVIDDDDTLCDSAQEGQHFEPGKEVMLEKTMSLISITYRALAPLQLVDPVHAGVLYMGR